MQARETQESEECARVNKGHCSSPPVLETLVSRKDCPLVLG